MSSISDIPMSLADLEEIEKELSQPVKSPNDQKNFNDAWARTVEQVNKILEQPKKQVSTLRILRNVGLGAAGIGSIALGYHLYNKYLKHGYRNSGL